jgi:hypothetical protein
MKTAKEFIKNMRFVEDLDSEISADRESAAKQDRHLPEDVIPPKAPRIVDANDDSILAVMNGYFSHVNEMETDPKCDHLQDLVHRMANTMLNMPNGEKALRKALTGAIKSIGAGEPAQPVQEDKSQVLQIQSKIDGLKKQIDDEKVKLNADPKGSGAGASKKKIVDLNDQVAKLNDQKKDAAKNESIGSTSPQGRKIMGYAEAIHTLMDRFRLQAIALIGEVKRAPKLDPEAASTIEFFKETSLHDVIYDEEDFKDEFLGDLEIALDESVPKAADFNRAIKASTSLK